MAVGTIARSVLTGIANAIRQQNGGSKGYKPSEMAPAVAALDGTKGNVTLQATMPEGTGIVSSSVYSDGELVVTASSTPDASRAVVASGRLCAQGRYERIGYMAWGDDRGSVVKAAFAADLSAYDYVNLNYFFHGFSALEEVTGMTNLPGCREMRYAFASCGLTELDLSGFDASQCEDLFYCFAGSDLVTIWADADFAYPEGCSGSGMFYSCDALVGGAGTTYDFSRRNIEYFRIDGGELAPGYLTAKE